MNELILKAKERAEKTRKDLAVTNADAIRFELLAAILAELRELTGSEKPGIGARLKKLLGR